MTGTLFAKESGLKNIHDECTFLNEGPGSSVEDPMEESEQEPWV
jgi:hypothetical protein